MKKGRSLRITAVLLAALFLSQCFTAVIGTSPGAQSYTGTILAAVNTDYTASYFGKSFEPEMPENPVEASVQAQSDQPQAENNLRDLLWDQIEPMTPEEAAQTLDDGYVEAQRTKASYNVGDTRKIPKYPDLLDTSIRSIKDIIKWIINYVRDNKTLLTCVYTDDNCTVWIEDVNAWPESSIRDLGQFVDSAIPQLEDLFGDVRIDTDGDGKFAIFIHSFPLSEDVPESRDGTAAGYFMPADLVDKSGRLGNVRMKEKITDSLILGSNADCFHINMDFKDLDEIKIIFVHEYQHYIHSCYSYAGKDNKTYLSEDDTYINEGFSVASETILCPTDWRIRELTFAFNDADSNTSLVNWRNVFENYALVYPFFQYIRTRYAELTGDKSVDYPGKGVYKRVMQLRDRSNQDNTLGIIADLLYPVDRYPSLRNTDERCRQLITDFWLAVYYKAPQGEFGFQGEDWANDLKAPIGSLSENQTIQNAMSIFYVLNDGESDTVTISRADDGIRFVAIEEPLRSVTLEPNGGSGDAYTRTTMDARFSLPSREYSGFYRAGYALDGWALTSDAETAVYAPNEKITVNGAVTLYAVWKPIQPNAADTAYPFDLANGEYTAAEFCPTEDGVYYLDSAADFYAVFVDSDGYSQSLVSVNDGVYLNAGETQTLYITFNSPSGAARVTGDYTLKLRTSYYTLLYYTEPFSDPEEWHPPYNTEEYGTTYTVMDLSHDYEGKDFCGWSTDPYAASAMYKPGDQITLTEDTALFAVFTPWFALQPEEPYSITSETANLRIVPDETAVYSLTANPTNSKYTYEIISEDDNIDDRYNVRTQSRTYTLYAGHTYNIYTKNIDRICLHLVSKTLQHSLVLYVPNLLTGARIKSLSVELTGSNTYTIPDYRPVPIMYSSFEYWVDIITEKIYYPGETVTLDRDTVLMAFGESSGYTTSTLSSLAFDMMKAVFRFIPLWVRSFVQRVRLFGLSNMNFEIPWLAD